MQKAKATFTRMHTFTCRYDGRGGRLLHAGQGHLRQMPRPFPPQDRRLARGPLLSHQRTRDPVDGQGGTLNPVPCTRDPVDGQGGSLYPAPCTRNPVDGQGGSPNPNPSLTLT